MDEKDEKPDFIRDVVMKMAHEIDAEKVTFYRSGAWPGNALNELNHHYEQALTRYRAQHQERSDEK